MRSVFVRFAAATSAAAFAVATLTACSGGTLATPGRESEPSARKGKLVLRIRVPKKQRGARERGRYISSATQGMTVAIGGPTVVNETVSLQPSSSGCSSSLSGTLCTLSIPGLAPCTGSGNCYSASIATYDAVSCSPSCTIPRSANELSANQGFGFAIVAGENNAIGITLGGIPASVAFIPLQSSMSGSVASGFTMGKCGPDSVTVAGVDADGNLILGAGSPVPSLQSNATSQVAVATPAPSSPNAFALTHPISPSPQPGATLTATVTPVAAAGASPQSVQVPIDSIAGGTQICGVVTEYAIPTANSGPKRIATAHDGNLWFTESSADKIAKITPAGSVTEYSTGLTASSAPFGIAECADDTMYFTESAGNNVGIVSSAGVIAEYSIPTAGAQPAEIARVGSAFFFTESNADQIGRILSLGAGGISEYAVNTPSARPFAIAAGPDGNAWFTESATEKIGSISTDGSVQNEYPVTTTGGLDSIASGPDGNLWFVEADDFEVASITTNGTIAEYSLPETIAGATSITSGPDGALWYAAGNIVGRIATDGTAGAQYVVSGGTLGGMTPGPDGDLWFVDSGNNKIGRLQ